MKPTVAARLDNGGWAASIWQHGGVLLGDYGLNKASSFRNSLIQTTEVLRTEPLKGPTNPWRHPRLQYKPPLPVRRRDLCRASKYYRVLTDSKKCAWCFATPTPSPGTPSFNNTVRGWKRSTRWFSLMAGMRPARTLASRSRGFRSSQAAHSSNVSISSRLWRIFFPASGGGSGTAALVAGILPLSWVLSGT